jgi:hypothetical protein
MFAYQQSGIFPLPPATGGTITTGNIGNVNYTFHTFTSNGHFTINTDQLANSQITFVVVGAGGTGGRSHRYNQSAQGYDFYIQCGGGGGGGQVIQASGIVGSRNSTYEVTVGRGRVWPTSGSPGESSQFFGSTAQGGGAGGIQFSGISSNTTADLNGYAGSSGGGGGSVSFTFPGSNGGAALAVGGNPGGAGGYLQAYGAGGGGSQISAGNGRLADPAPGGNKAGASGVAVTIYGNTIYCGAGGGGGGSGFGLNGNVVSGTPGGTGGSSVGGNGSGYNNSTGAYIAGNSQPFINSGSGSGGGSLADPAAGADGIVIIRYPTPGNVVIG